MFPLILCSILIVIGLIIKIQLMRKNIAEIYTEFTKHLSTDTNTLISTTSNDKHIKHLANEINKQLRILRKQRLQYLNGDREIKDAVTNISHDLRTPLTVICGYLDLLCEEEKSEEVERYLLLIKNRTEALNQLTEELFRYSVVASSTEDMQFEVVCINSVLEESIAGFYTALVERKISPTINMPEKDIFQMVNKAALSRVFSNILSNALKYSDGDLDISLLENGKIIFTNTATQLDEIQVGKLFNRFYTVEATRKGTGLGLAISKTLVEQMNGTISVQYIENKLSVCIEICKELW